MQEKLEKQLDPLWAAANDKDIYLLQLQASLFPNTICNDFFPYLMMDTLKCSKVAMQSVKNCNDNENMILLRNFFAKRNIQI